MAIDIEKEFERLGLGRKPDNTVKLVEPVEERSRGMQYNLIQANEPQDLVDRVTKIMEKGWRPLGGIAISCYQPDSLYPFIKYAQAMVRD